MPLACGKAWAKHIGHASVDFQLCILNFLDLHAQTYLGQRRCASRVYLASNLMAPKRKKADTDEKSDVAKKAPGRREGVHPARIKVLNEGAVQKGAVIYWMSRDQRVRGNWALLYACEKAAKTGSSVAVVFNLVESYCNAGARQFGFMLRGLKLMQPKLKELNIPLFMLKGEAKETIPQFVEENKAALVIVDFSPLRDGRRWREEVAASLGDVPLHEVDAHNVVPVWEASDKREYGARTIRTKIHKKLPEFFKEIPTVPKQPVWNGSLPQEFDWDSEIARVLNEGKEVPEVQWIQPGEDSAWEALIGEKGFINRMKGFHQLRNDPNGGAQSDLSPYLHFGHLSAQEMAVEVSSQKQKYRDEVNAFLEEAIVRRELSDNFCYYEPNYDSLEACSDWAKDSLEKHRTDQREHIYTWQELEEGKTHDDLWNASQLEMVHHGKMSSFNRMYWAKKILEWTESPEQALEWSIKLNDKWELDGRDSNGYVGCMWSIGGIHDQGWSERKVFGKVRYMNYNGCKRKFDVTAYVDRIHKLAEGSIK